MVGRSRHRPALGAEVRAAHLRRQSVTENVLIALIAAAPPTLMALAGLIISLRNQRAIGVVKTQTDGLVAASNASSKAEGVTQGHAEAAANSLNNR